MSFAANCFRRTEVKYKKIMVLLHEFDDNVAVVATTVASITTGILQFQAKQRQRRSLVPSWGSVCVPAGRVCGARGGGSPHLPTSVSPLASSNDGSRALANATSKCSVSQRKHRKRYRTFALRNARLLTPL